MRIPPVFAKAVKEVLNLVRHKNQRVGIFVDVQNLYYSAKHLYNTKVNFNSILREAVAGRKLIRGFCYVIKADIKVESTFFGALEKIGFEKEKREFKPHITLGRVKRYRKVGNGFPVNWKDKEISFGFFCAEQVFLMKSTLRPDGARYEKIGTFAFMKDTHKER